jgi:hypothetical protein
MHFRVVAMPRSFWILTANGNDINPSIMTRNKFYYSQQNNNWSRIVHYYDHKKIQEFIVSEHNSYNKLPRYENPKKKNNLCVLQ